MADEQTFLTKQEVVIKFLIFGGGIFLTFGAYTTVLFLQSSINIEDGVGAASVTGTYVTAAIVGIVITPVLLQLLGAKVSALLSQCCYLVYVAANFYPEAYILIPAGVIAGVAEATMWPSMLLFSVHYARCYARHGSRDTRSYVTEFIGYFFVMFQLSQMTGNLISYGILYAGKTPQSPNDSTTANPFESTPSPWDNTPGSDLSVCGANDCQDPNVTQANLDQYLPATQRTLFITLGVNAGMILAAIAVIAILVRRIDPKLEVSEEVSDVHKAAEPASQKTYQRIWTTVKNTVLHMIDPRQLLITPFALYTGLLMSFAFGEMTRAFASCLLGVDQVGLCMAIYSAADGFLSYVISKLSSRYGRTYPLLLGLVFDLTNYMMCLFWIPTSDNLWVVYLMFVMVGFVDGTWQPLVNEMHASYFPDNQEIAFSVWNLWTLVGIAIQYGWSTSICVRDKIYIQLGLLAFSLVAYFFGEYHYHRDQKTNNIEEDIVIKNSSAL